MFFLLLIFSLVIRQDMHHVVEVGRQPWLVSAVLHLVGFSNELRGWEGLPTFADHFLCLSCIKVLYFPLKHDAKTLISSKLFLDR